VKRDNPREKLALASTQDKLGWAWFADASSQVVMKLLGCSLSNDMVRLSPKRW
jgi:hypothetical protein